MSQKAQEPKPTDAARKPYVAPRFEVFGDLGAITKNLGSGKKNDPGDGKTKT